MNPSDLLLYVGGAALRRYGTLFRRTQIPRRGGEDGKATFTRSTAAGYHNRDLLHALTAVDVPAPWWFDLNADVVAEWLGIMVEDARENLCLRSEDLTTAPWSLTGTPTWTPAALTLGNINLGLLGDDDAVSSEDVRQTITLSGGAGARVCSVHVKVGTSAPASGSLIEWFDSTAVADRLFATLTFDGNKVPQLSMTVGEYLGSLRYPGDRYRLFFRTTAATTSANTNVFIIAPAKVGTEQGNLYVGGVVINNEVSPTFSYDKTLGATVTRGVVTWTHELPLPLVDITLYARLKRPWYADLTGSLGTNPGIWGFASGDGRFDCYFENANRNLISIIRNAAGDVSSSVAITAGDPVRVLAQYRNWKTGPSTRLAVNGGAFTAWSAAGSAISAFGNSTLVVGARTGLVDRVNTAIEALMVARGQQDEAAFAELLP